MMLRCENLLKASDVQGLADGVRDDMRRSVVVLSVAALDTYAVDRFMEEFAKYLKRHELKYSQVRVLEESGISVKDVLEMLRLGVKRPYRRIRTKVEHHFSTKSYQSFRAINELYRFYGLPHIVDDAVGKAHLKTLGGKVDKMIRRRHSIVHEGDFNGWNKPDTIDRRQVGQWPEATRIFVRNMEAIVGNRFDREGEAGKKM